MPDTDFDPIDFLPYLLNQAAEAASLQFQEIYKGRYGLLRTEWRVLFHLGRCGDMTAKEICDRARLHKTKVSRAVRKLEQRRYLQRSKVPKDRRNEMLSLTKAGHTVCDDLINHARSFNEEMKTLVTAEEYDILQVCLKKFAGFD